MYRTAIEALYKWKENRHRKPLVIEGARQVGKTWLMKEFGRKAYAETVYINFDSNSTMSALFSSDLDTDRLIMGIELYAGKKIDPDQTLLIFDEVQEVPKALSSLKYFYENAPQYHIICAGSLLGIDALRQYYFVGGMPEAVQEFAAERDFNEVREIQKRILAAYEQDFSKHAPIEIVPKIRMVWNSIPSQLAKENKKFIYGLVREGGRCTQSRKSQPQSLRQTDAKKGAAKRISHVLPLLFLCRNPLVYLLILFPALTLLFHCFIRFPDILNASKHVCIFIQTLQSAMLLPVLL